MSFQIFYEDRHGNAVDEYGRPEPMNYIIGEERYALETVSSHTQYLHNQPQENNFDVDVCMKETSSKRAYTSYTDQDKVRSYKLMFECFCCCETIRYSCSRSSKMGSKVQNKS
ncbi:hypothetical protein RMCBS344292_12652 [Rhizopus microsporus]|nr:hypothetical protein RMCBS344292_12652 [Rhizopus microsporus]